jgi:ribosomal protein S18 acetylase RimI-like enzyme
MTAVIRSFQSGDRDALITLWADCDLTRPENDPSRDIDRKLARDPENLLVLDADGAIVGSVMLGYDGHRGWINYLAVHPSHRRQGWARRLMEEAERRLRDVGCAKINLQVRSSNRETIAFYSQVGFVVDDVIGLGKRLEFDQ